MLDRLQKIEGRYNELCEQLMDPEITKNPQKYREIAKEKRGLDRTVGKFKEYKEILKTIEEDEAVLKADDDVELLELAETELGELRDKRISLEEELKLLLLPKNPNDVKNAIIEIRAGTGGDEAGIFAGDLFRMYVRFAERKKWKI